MSEAKGLNKPVKLKKELSELLGAKEMPRTEIVQKLWDHIKKHKLQAKTEGGKATGEGAHVVADEKLLSVFKNTNVTSKKGVTTDLTKMKVGDTIHMTQMAHVVSANIE